MQLTWLRDYVYLLALLQVFFQHYQKRKEWEKQPHSRDAREGCDFKVRNCIVYLFCKFGFFLICLIPWKHNNFIFGFFFELLFCSYLVTRTGPHGIAGLVLLSVAVFPRSKAYYRLLSSRSPPFCATMPGQQGVTGCVCVRVCAPHPCLLHVLCLAAPCFLPCWGNSSLLATYLPFVVFVSQFPLVRSGVSLS